MRSLAVAGAALTALMLSPWVAHAVPGEESGSLEEGTVGAALDLAVSTDGRYLAAAEASGGGLSIWDSRAFSSGSQTPSVCSAHSVAFVGSDSNPDRFYVGCGEGLVHYVDLDTSTTPPGLTVSEPIEANTGFGDVVALLHASGDSYVYAVVQDSTIASLHRIATSQEGGTDAEDLALYGTFTVTAAALGEQGSPLVLARADGFLNFHVRSGDDFAAASLYPNSALGTLEAVAVSNAADLVLVTDSSEDAVWSFPASGSVVAVPWGPSVTEPLALGFGESPSAPVAYVASGAPALLAVDSAELEQADLELGGGRPDVLVAVPEVGGDVYVGSSDTSVRVLSERPFVGTIKILPSSIGEDEETSFHFTCNQDGDYELRLGGDGSADSGVLLASGEALAGEEAILPVKAEDLVEGSNRLFVYVTGDSGTGVDSDIVTLDGPPEAVGALTVGPGDERLSVSWTSSAEEDLDYFEVYVSDSSFDEASLPTFVVEPEGESETSYPVEVAWGGVELGHSLSIEGLENGVTYFLAVRAIDAGGQIGALSALASGEPAQTCGAAECANDPGCSCESSLSGAEGAGGSFLLLLVGVWLLRRRGG